jgi:hypothetical protein
VRCEVQRGSGSLDEWPRSDSARVGIENDSTSAPLLRCVKSHDNLALMFLRLQLHHILFSTAPMISGALVETSDKFFRSLQ